VKEDFNEVMDELLNSFMEDVHTIIPGKIEEYEGHEKRKAKVKPLVKLKNSRGKIIEIESIEDVPVIFPGTKDFSMLFPLKEGDGVLLLFSEVNLGNFLDSDDIQEADDNQRFSLTDCIAIPGFWSFKNVPDAPENDDDFFLTFQDASIQIVDETNEVKITDGDENKVHLLGTDGVLIERSDTKKITMDDTETVVQNGTNQKITMSSSETTIQHSTQAIMKMNSTEVNINNGKLTISNT